MKINYPLILPPVLLTIFCVVAIFLSEAVSSKPLEVDKIHEHAQELASYTRESKTLLSQYQKGHLTETYLIMQLKQIQKQVVSTADTLSSADIKTGDEENISSLIELSENYAKQIRAISRSPENKQLISKTISELDKETAQIDAITKRYE